MYSLDSSGLKVLYGRQKINNLCFGQRLEYEAEGGNNGFSYQRRYADVIPGNGGYVLHPCITNCDATPRILCDSIYENLQHSNIVADFFSVADVGNWYLKPVMRIKQSDFSSSDTRPVIAIIVKNFDGSYGDTMVVRVNNFRNSSGNYDGSYTSTFTFLGSEDSSLISGDTSHLNKERNRRDINECKIDFKIYWYGQVEVWFDKLIVDDEMGNNLFNANPDIKKIFETKISEEVKEFSVNNNHPSIYTYYADEMVYSNIPCVERVQKIMKDSSNGLARLSCATTNNLNVQGMRNDTLAYRVFLQRISPTLFTNDAHENM